jgi:ribosome-binding factor A
MDLRKLERSTALLREELTNILRSEVRDPRLNAVTVSSVRLSRDRRYARVFVDLAESGQEEEQEVLAALNRAAGFVRRCLAQRLSWYKAPEVSFQLDEGMKEGDRVLALFRDIESDEGPTDDAPHSANSEASPGNGVDQS